MHLLKLVFTQHFDIYCTLLRLRQQENHDTFPQRCTMIDSLFHQYFLMYWDEYGQNIPNDVLSGDMKLFVSGHLPRDYPMPWWHVDKVICF